MAKTSVYLNRELTAEWKASGLPLAELVRRGLHTSDLEDTLRRVLREELGTVAMPATDSTEEEDRSTPPLLLAAMPALAGDDLDSGTVSCKHPAASVNDGVCACGAELDPA